MQLTDDAVARLIGYVPPGAFRLEDLSGLPPGNMLLLLLDRSLGLPSQGPTGFPGAPIWWNFVRLTDQAIRTHEAARSALEEWPAADNNSKFRLYYYRAVDNLEQCVFAVARAMLMAKELNAMLRRLPWPTDAEYDNVKRCATPSFIPTSACREGA